MKITKNELLEKLKEVSGTVFTNITYFTDEAKSKTVKGKKAVQKMVTLNVTIGSNYESKVNRILETKQGEEANFEAQALKGRVHVDNTSALLWSEKSQDYLLNAIVENHSGGTKTTTYYVGGLPKTLDEIKELDLLTPSFFTEKPVTMGRGAIDVANNFSIIQPKISNIKSIKLFGETYDII